MLMHFSKSRINRFVKLNLLYCGDAAMLMRFSKSRISRFIKLNLELKLYLLMRFSKSRMSRIVKQPTAATRLSLVVLARNLA
jgi:hypothetical protein